MSFLGPFLALAIPALLLALLPATTRLLIARQRPRHPPLPPPIPAIDTFRFTSRHTLCSPTELAFYHALTKAFPHTTVMTKVRLVDLVDAEHRHAFNHLKAKHIDFLLCDPHTLAIRAAIELDDATHAKAYQARSDQMKTHALASAGIPLYRFTAAASYSPTAIRDTLIPPAANA